MTAVTPEHVGVVLVGPSWPLPVPTGGSLNAAHLSIMWIKTTLTDSAGEPVVRRLRNAATDGYVDFSENGKAQVTKEVGEQLVEQHDSIVPVETASDDAADGDDDDEGSTTGDG